MREFGQEPFQATASVTALLAYVLAQAQQQQQHKQQQQQQCTLIPATSTHTNMKLFAPPNTPPSKVQQPTNEP
jgi:hypothetical protein